jgi:hypothetical protein
MIKNRFLFVLFLFFILCSFSPKFLPISKKGFFLSLLTSLFVIASIRELFYLKMTFDNLKSLNYKQFLKNYNKLFLLKNIPKIKERFDYILEKLEIGKNLVKNFFQLSNCSTDFFEIDKYEFDCKIYIPDDLSWVDGLFLGKEKIEKIKEKMISMKECFNKEINKEKLKEDFLKMYSNEGFIVTEEMKKCFDLHLENGEYSYGFMAFFYLNGEMVGFHAPGITYDNEQYWINFYEGFFKKKYRNLLSQQKIIECFCKKIEFNDSDVKIRMFTLFGRKNMAAGKIKYFNFFDYRILEPLNIESLTREDKIKNNILYASVFSLSEIILLKCEKLNKYKKFLFDKGHIYGKNERYLTIDYFQEEMDRAYRFCGLNILLFLLKFKNSYGYEHLLEIIDNIDEKYELIKQILLATVKEIFIVEEIISKKDRCPPLRPCERFLKLKSCKNVWIYSINKKYLNRPQEGYEQLMKIIEFYYINKDRYREEKIIEMLRLFI